VSSRAPHRHLVSDGALSASISARETERHGLTPDDNFKRGGVSRGLARGVVSNNSRSTKRSVHTWTTETSAQSTAHYIQSTKRFEQDLENIFGSPVGPSHG